MSNRAQQINSMLLALTIKAGINIPTPNVAPLLAQSKELNAGFTDIHYAAAAGHLDTLEALIQADPNGLSRPDYHGQTPMHWAAKSAQTGALTILLRHGTEPDTPDTNGRTALHLATRAGATEAVRVLVKHGANTTAQDTDGLTPANIAENRGYKHCIAALRQRDTNPANTTQRFFRTPTNDDNPGEAQSNTAPHL